MKTLVVYDSQFGNTERVAHTIGEVLAVAHTSAVVHVHQIEPAQLSNLDLLIVGSPTQRLNMTPAMTNFFKTIPRGTLKGVRVAVFDTRFTDEHIQSIRVLPFFVRIFGYAAEKIARRLEALGGIPAGVPGFFYVIDTEGPLLEDELQRAAVWVKSVMEPA